MGSDCHFPEEKPAHKVMVDDFYIDIHPVTNSEFRRFVEASGYLTLAELVNEAAHQTGEPSPPSPHGSYVLLQQKRRMAQEWRLLAEANWRHPFGKHSDIRGLDDHPVVHIAYADAHAYARWSGKELPTEAQWEYAANAGGHAEYPWGAELAPSGIRMANTWHSAFSTKSRAEDRNPGTSAVSAYPSNAFGVFDMIGNAWEWTTDFWSPRHDRPRAHGIRRNPKVTNAVDSCLTFGTAGQVPRRVLKGGSHLCDPRHSNHLRPAARCARPIDGPACDIGFRCVRLATSESPQP